MPSLFLPGQKFNLFERAQSITVSDEDADAPKGNLHDGRPLRPFKFATVGSSSRSIGLRNQILLNNKLDTWAGGLPTSWSKVGAGTVTQESTDVVSGSAAKIAGSETWLQQDVTVKAGERLRIQGQMHSLAGVVARTAVKNLKTGYWLRGSDLTWQSAYQDLWTTTSGTYVLNTSDFQVQSYAACRADLVSLRVHLYQATGGGTGLYDDFFLIPAVDFLGVFGHNIEALISVTLRYSSDNFATENVLLATPTVYDPSFYYWNSAGVTYREWWEVGLIGTQSTPPGLGELVLGQAATLGRFPNAPQASPWTVAFERAQVRHESDAGDVYAFHRGGWRRRVLGVPYRRIKDLQLVEMIDEIRNRTEDGIHPLVVVPESARPDVIHGRVDQSFEARRVFFDGSQFRHEHDLIVRESAFPNFAA